MESRFSKNICIKIYSLEALERYELKQNTKRLDKGIMKYEAFNIPKSMQIIENAVFSL